MVREIRSISITDLEPNLEYILSLMIENGIRAHSIQRTIRIHLYVSSIKRVRRECGPKCVLTILNLKSERTGQHSQFFLEADTMYLGK